MTKDEQIELFYDYLTTNYKDIKKKYRQMCFLSHLTYSEDVLNDTVVKVTEKIKKDGIKANTLKEMDAYFFRAFKLNTLQEHYQNQRRLIDENIQPQDVDLIDESSYEEEQLHFNDFFKKFVEVKIKEHFNDLYFSIYRLRYLITINGKNLNYKQIKKITGVQSTRKIIVEVNRYMKDNYPLSFIKNEYKNNAKTYFN